MAGVHCSSPLFSRHFKGLLDQSTATLILPFNGLASVNSPQHNTFQRAHVAVRSLGFYSILTNEGTCLFPM